jgi:membrane-associated phospholipid phosphatase
VHYFRISPKPTPISRPVRIAFFVIGAVICAVSFAWDDAVIRWVAAHQNATVHRVAVLFSQWGDFLPIAGVLLLGSLIAWVLKRHAALRLLLLMLGSAAAAGLAANILRVLTGRTRPSAKVPPGWFGFFDHGHWIAGTFSYSSFPSAHTAVAFACTVPLWLILRGPRRLLIAIPATLIALSIAASRILLNSHHLSDVVTSIYLAILISTWIYTRYSLYRRPSVHGAARSARSNSTISRTIS